jgi:hypothetical protein
MNLWTEWRAWVHFKKFIAPFTKGAGMPSLTTNIKTTLAGVIGAIAVAVAAYQGHSWRQLVVAVAIAAVGYFAKDAE